MNDDRRQRILKARCINASDECWADIAKEQQAILEYAESQMDNEFPDDSLKFKLAVTVLGELAMRQIGRMEQEK